MATILDTTTGPDGRVTINLSVREDGWVEVGPYVILPSQFGVARVEAKDRPGYAVFNGPQKVANLLIGAGLDAAG